MSKAADESELIRQAMSILGKRTSERKKISSRRNAKRPRKKKKPEFTRKPETANAVILYPVNEAAEIFIDEISKTEPRQKN